MTTMMQPTLTPLGFFVMPNALSAADAGDLLRAKRVAKGMTQEQVATALDLANPNYVSLLEKGKVNLGRSKYLPALARLLGLSANEVSSINPDVIVELQQSPVPTSSQFVDVHRLPIYNSAAAGRPFVGDDDILGIAYVADSLYRPTMKVIKVCGDSMAPTIEDGDQVFIDTNQCDPISNKIFAIHLPGDGLILKRAMQIAGHWMLVSDNHKYPPLAPDEGVIVGRAYHHLPQGGGL